MPDLQPPRDATPDSTADVLRVGAVQAPRHAKDRIALELWRPEAVRGCGEAEVARIAEQQRGIVSRRQLLEAGLTPAAIKHRLQIERLHVLHPGVYLLGRPRLEPLASATAAVLYLDGFGALSERTAGAIWGQIDAPELPVHVTTFGAGYRSRRGLIVHRNGSVSPADVRCCKGLPVISPAQTLVEMAAVVTIEELESALAVTRRLKLATDQEIREAIARAPYAKGVGNLRALLAQTGPPRLTRSKYERKLLKLIAAAQLPRPIPNAKVEGVEVDLYWPDHRLIVEFDSLAFHLDRAAFEKDRLRDQRLIAAGYRVIRITARQIDTTPEAVIARIAQALIH